MNRPKTHPSWINKAIQFTVPVTILCVTALFFTQSTFANQPIVPGVQPLPVMQVIGYLRQLQKPNGIN